MADSQSVELRDRAGMVGTVLTLQQFWIAPPGFAVTLAGRNRTLRRMGRAQRNPSPSRAAMDGYRFRLRSLSYGGQGAPSILQIGHTRRARATKSQNLDCPTDFVSKRISDSIRTSRDVRFAFHV